VSKETPKQKLRRLLDRLPVDAAKKRELDALIEEASDQDAEMFADWLDEIERENPGAIDEAIREIAKHGIPDD
jgi:hypothetical protein